MTITYQAKGSTSSGTTTMDVALPAGYTTGDLLLAWVSSYPESQTPSTPSGWTQVCTGTGGAGTAGETDGPRRVTIFAKVAASASETTPTTTQSSATGNALSGRCWYFTRSAGSGWDVDGVTGPDDSEGTDYSATASAAVTGDIDSGDLLVTATVTHLTTASGGTPTITAAGATVGSQNNVDNVLNTASGYDLRTDVKWFSITAGASSAAPTYAATYTAATSGATAFVRLREAVDHATFDLTATYTTDTTDIASWSLDATGSTGTTSLTQTSGTTVGTITESPTGVFTFANPSGIDDLVFDLDAGTDTAVVTIERSGSGRPAVYSKTASGWV